MKTMTKEQAEKAAMEFAWKKIEEGLYVQKIIHGSIISVYYTKGLMQFDGKSFPFVDLVPGDACLVWRDNKSLKNMRVFNRIEENGDIIFNDTVSSARLGSSGRPWPNYRQLGFNVLETEEG